MTKKKINDNNEANGQTIDATAKPKKSSKPKTKPNRPKKKVKAVELPDVDYNDIIKMAPILFKNAGGDMRFTCMAFGIEAGRGWYEPIKELAATLEIINLTIGKKYKMAIQAEQVKEKFGTLHFYYNIVSYRKFFWHEVGHAVTWPVKMLAKLFELCRLDTIANNLVYKANAIDEWFWSFVKEDPTDPLAMIVIDDLAGQAIRRAEKECLSRCERCGRQIGTSYSPRYETEGWISYVCKDCVGDRPAKIIKDKDLFNC